MDDSQRRIAHFFGITICLVGVLFVVDWLYFQKPVGATTNMATYTWLASVNMHGGSDVSPRAIERGEVALLVADNTDLQLVNAKLMRQQQRLVPDPQLLGLLHLEHQEDAVVDAHDLLYRKLYLATYLGNGYRVVPLPDSPVRALQVHRDGVQLAFKVVLSNGKVLPMVVSPSDRVYKPLVG